VESPQGERQFTMEEEKRPPTKVFVLKICYVRG